MNKNELTNETQRAQRKSGLTRAQRKAFFNKSELTNETQRAQRKSGLTRAQRNLNEQKRTNEGNAEDAEGEKAEVEEDNIGNQYNN